MCICVITNCSTVLCSLTVVTCNMLITSSTNYMQALVLLQSKLFPYSLPELIPVYRLSSLSTRSAAAFPAEVRHCPSTSTKLYCLMTEAHRCEQLAQGCYTTALGENWTHDLMITSPQCHQCWCKGSMLLHHTLPDSVSYLLNFPFLISELSRKYIYRG